jgi:hypothetical protein
MNCLILHNISLAAGLVVIVMYIQARKYICSKFHLYCQFLEVIFVKQKNVNAWFRNQNTDVDYLQRSEYNSTAYV